MFKGFFFIVFGVGEFGGLINLIFKKFLDEFYYNVVVFFGNYNDYCLDVDLFGFFLLEVIDIVNYCFNVFYEIFGSF